MFACVYIKTHVHKCKCMNGYDCQTLLNINANKMLNTLKYIINSITTIAKLNVCTYVFLPLQPWSVVIAATMQRQATPCHTTPPWHHIKPQLNIFHKLAPSSATPTLSLTSSSRNWHLAMLPQSSSLQTPHMKLQIYFCHTFEILPIGLLYFQSVSKPRFCCRQSTDIDNSRSVVVTSI